MYLTSYNLTPASPCELINNEKDGWIKKIQIFTSSTQEKKTKIILMFFGQKAKSKYSHSQYKKNEQ